MIDTRTIETIASALGKPAEFVAEQLGHALANEQLGIRPLPGNPQHTILESYRAICRAQERPHG